MFEEVQGSGCRMLRFWVVFRSSYPQAQQSDVVWSLGPKALTYEGDVSSNRGI